MFLNKKVLMWFRVRADRSSWIWSHPLLCPGHCQWCKIWIWGSKSKLRAFLSLSDVCFAEERSISHGGSSTVSAVASIFLLTKISGLYRLEVTGIRISKWSVESFLPGTLTPVRHVVVRKLWCHTLLYMSFDVQSHLYGKHCACTVALLVTGVSMSEWSHDEH